MKTTAIAPANIAFLKYWGKRDAASRLPANSSFSMNLTNATTVTTVEFSDEYTKDLVSFDGESVSSHEAQRIVDHITVLRTLAGSKKSARIVTKNSFPKGTGVASSASGFAALTVAASGALGLTFRERELTILARRGSGSACRSIPDGFVVWEKGASDDTSYARSIAPSTFWNLRDVLCIVDTSMKKVSTSEGHQQVSSSPLWEKRQQGIDRTLSCMLDAFHARDFVRFGQLVEDECLSMHAVMQTQIPPLHYWNDVTIELMKSISKWREDGLPVYYTIDAGPNVHVLCEAKHEQQVVSLVGAIGGVSRVIVNAPAEGARTVTSHLF